jgi:hypothetical protein
MPHAWPVGWLPRVPAAQCKPGRHALPHACALHAMPPSRHRHCLFPCPQALSDFKESWQYLPEQIALEVHFSLGAGMFPITTAKNSPQMTLLFSHLANLGYAVVARDDNPIASLGCCSEFTFLRVEESQLAAVVQAPGRRRRLHRRLHHAQRAQ